MRPIHAREPGVSAGMTAHDDYLWLRDPTRGPRLLEFLQQEESHYVQHARRFDGLRRQIVRRMEDLAPVVDLHPQWQVGTALYCFHRERDQEFGSLLRIRDGATTDILNLDDLAADTGYCQLGVTEISPDGNVLAFSVDRQGDEVYTLYFKDLTTHALLPDRVPHTYYGGAWTADSRHYYYIVHDSSSRPYRLFVHERGTPVTRDRLLLDETDPQFHLALRSVAGFAIASVASRETSEEWLIALDDPRSGLHSVASRQPGLIYSTTPYQDHEKTGYLIVTNLDAPEFRLAHAAEIGVPPSAWAALLPPDPGRRVLRATYVSGHVVLETRREGRARLLIFPLQHPEESVELAAPEPEATLRLAPHHTGCASEISVEIESYLDPLRVEAVDVRSRAARTTFTAEVGNYQRSSFVGGTITATVRDGTAVPVTLARAKSTPLDGSAPCLLLGYGAWETVVEPAFDSALIALLEHGVIFAHAHVRGGGELGRQWWDHGRMAQKINSFTDLIDVAVALGHGFVDPARIVIRGRSAGGLLVGGAYSMRPEMWKGVIAEVPFVDPITTMLDSAAPLVAVERDEWGDPRRPADRAWMMKWSPFDNIPPPTPRPQLLVTSSLNDPRVSVWEPARWVARLRATDSESENIAFRVQLNAGGHAIPPGRTQHQAYTSEIMAWALHVMTDGRSTRPN